jgi:drug/metabolite transporter (DMT)-like permease
MNDAMLKWVVTDHPLGETIFVRGMFALIPTLFLVYRHGGRAALRIHDFKAQVVCAVLLVLPIFLFIFSLRHLDLGVAIILVYAGPLLATALGSWVLHERVDARRWGAVGVGFAGVVLVVQPASQAFSPLMLIPVLVALLIAARDIIVRRMLARESTVSIHLYSSLAVMLIALVTSVHEWVPLSLQAWLSLALSGLGFGFGIFFVTDALRYADVSLVSPFKYTGVVWALALGYLMWGEVPTMPVVAGALVIVGSGLFLLRQSSSGRAGSR